MRFKLALIVVFVAAFSVVAASTPADGRYSSAGVISYIAKNQTFESSLRQVRPGQNPGFIMAPDFAVHSYAWAPEGSRIAFVASAANDLWVETLFDGNITFIASAVGTATWSPDGTRIAFTDATGGKLYVKPPDGSSVEPILAASGLKNPAWSPLGDAIVFEAGNALKSIPPTGGTAVALDGAAGGKQPARSPFGDMIAALKGNTVIIVDRDGDLVQTIDASKGATGFSWSPDGTAITFNRPVSNKASDGQAIYIAGVGDNNATGADATKVSSAATTAGPPAWSPDGRSIAYTLANSGEKAEVWVVDVDGTHELRLTDNVVLDEQAIGWQTLPVLIGDGDCNGVIEMTDFVALMRMLAGVGAPPCPLALNVRCADPLTAADALPLLEHIAQIQATLPDGCFAIGS